MNDKLAKRIAKLIKAEDWKELQDLLLNTEDEWVLEMVEQRLYRADGPQWVGGLLTALTCLTRESTSLRLKVYEAVLRVVRAEVGGSERSTGELVGVLMVHVDAFPAHTLVTLVEQYMDHLRTGAPLQGRWVDLLAKIITSVSQKEEVTVEGRKMSGEDYRYQVLKSVCDLPWSAETTTSLLPVIRDMDLPKEELEDVIHKVEKVLKQVEYQGVPPIMYHLVPVVQSKLPGRVLQLAIAYFNRQDLKMAATKPRKAASDINSVDLDEEEDAIEDSRKNDLTEAKGTVILHLTHHAQYNPDLVRDYLKLIKSSTWLTERLVTPFNLTLAFSLTSIEKFQDQILESLKSCLLKFFREEERSRQCQWLRVAWGSDCDLQNAFVTTVENCVMGWDQVSQGVVQLAFSLLESGGGPKGETYASQQAVELAGLVLPLIVKRQSHLARPVLSQLSNFILLASSPMQYIVILEKLARLVPLALLDHQNVLQEILEYLEHLSLGAATYLLQALRPLLRMNMTLKDALVITLRKMLFSRRVESRQIAVRGFLQFLKHYRVMGTLPSSQASMSFSSSLSTVSVNVDVHSDLSSSTNESLCLELLGVLRRCFCQQQEVRCTLYHGLPEVCAVNPRLTVSVLEMLLQHSRTFMDLRADALNPVHLQRVVQVQGESVVLVEPLGDLLSTMAACQSCYLTHRDRLNTDDDDDDEDATAVLNQVCSMFDVLTEKLSGCDLEDMGINANGDFSSASPAGRKNLLSSQAMVSVFDGLLEYTFLQPQHSQETVQTILSLFKSQRKIIDLVKEKNQKSGKKGEGSKGKGRAPSKPVAHFRSTMSMRVTADMLAASLVEEEGQDNMHGILGSNHDLQMYLLSVVEEKLSSFKGMIHPEKEKILPHLKTIAKSLLEECLGCVGGTDSSNMREVTRLRQSLTTLANLFTIFSKYYKHKLESVLKDMLGKTEASTLNRLLHKMVKRCQKMVMRILNHEEREPLLKDATTLLMMLTTITQAMEQDSPELAEVLDWVLQLCKDQSFDNSPLTEALVKMLLQLSDQVNANHTLARGLARELHHKLGDHNQDMEVENVSKYQLVTEDSAPTVLVCSLAHLDTTLVLVELALNKLRACITAGVEHSAEKVEACVANKCATVIAATHEIIQSALPPGPCMDHTLTMVTRLYNVLSLYVRYYLDLYRLRSNAQLSEKFEKMVKVSGELVSVPVYPMITYIETTQREVLARGRGKQKGGGALTAQAIKESRLIPSLIYSLEQYEKHLITLSRKSKVNLMHGMKMSTTRDFRIEAAALLEDLERENDADTPPDRERNGQASDEEGESADEDGGRNSPVLSPQPSASINQKKRKATQAPGDIAGASANRSQHKASQPQVKKRKMSLKNGRKKV